MNKLHSAVDYWHRRCITSFVLRGEKTGDFGPNKGQSVMCVDLLRKVPLAGWFFVGKWVEMWNLAGGEELEWLLTGGADEFV